ncbi:MAG: hypothetical protein K2Q18_15005 [Bdellovibrionales bacterium]|nr:hypothetical protein [Bdellovibrionales bacterium]
MSANKLLFPIFFLLPVLTLAEDLKFSFPFSGKECSKNNLEICLTEQQPIGADVTLLSREKNQVCYGKVISHFTYKDEVLSFKASKIKTEKCLGDDKKYLTAIVGRKISSFNILIPKEMSKEEADKEGKVIFNSPFFEKYLRESESIKSFEKGKKIPYLISDFPDVVYGGLSYIDKDFSIMVITHHLFKDSLTPPGAMIAILGKDKASISDLCVSEQEKLMKIENQYYFYTKSQGCDTDYVLEEIYKTSGGKIELSFRDNSWSL